MRVAIVTSYNSKKPAGLERVLIEQLRAFGNVKDSEVEYVIYTSSQSDLDQVLKMEKIDLPVVKIGGGKLWKEFGLFFAPKADKYFFNGSLVPLFFKPREYYVLVYDFAYRYFSDNSMKQKIKNKLTDFISALAFRRAKKIVAISNATAEEICLFFKVDSKKITTIHLGWTAINKLKREPLEGLPEKYFMFIGTLKERKNVLSVVQAFADFKEKHSILMKLVIVGKRNDNSPYLRRINNFIKEKNLEERVFFTGHTTDEQVAYIYAHADALVFPSLLEGFGMPPLEAMSFGVPVITSSTSSLGEVAGDAAILVDPKSVPQIAEAMGMVIQDGGLRKDLITKGLERIKFFSWDKAALEYNNLFKNNPKTVVGMASDCKNMIPNNKKFFVFLFLLASLVIGAVYSIIPHGYRYVLLRDQGIRYVPITQKSHFDHMNVQAGRYREILDGNILSGEIDTYEHRSAPAIWPILSAVALAPIILLTKSVFATFIISDFLFPILMFVGFYFAIKSLTGHSIFSLFSSFVLMLFPQVSVLIPPSSLSELKNLILHFSPVPIGSAGISLNYLTRESFIPGGSVFLFFLFFSFKSVNESRKIDFFVFLAGIFYGLLFYFYLFYWIFATIFLGIFFIIALLKKEKFWTRDIFIIMSLGLAVSIPFWISHDNLAGLSNYQELMERAGMEVGRGVKWFLWKTYLLFFAIAGLAYWLKSKSRPNENKSWHLSLVSIAFASIAVYNINVVTGYFFQSDHWGNKVFLTTTGIIWAVLLYHFFEYIKDKFDFQGLRKFAALLVSLAAFFLASNVIISQMASSRNEINSYTVPSNLMNAYEWLNENTETGSVVMSPSLETNIDLSVYSHNRIWLARSQNTVATEKELLDRLFVVYNLFKIPTASLNNMLQTHKGVFYFFTAKYNSKAVDSSLRHDKYPLYIIPDDLRERILGDYVRFVALPGELPYRLNYVFVGPKEKEIGARTEFLEKKEKIYDQGNVQIYKW